MTTYLTRKAQSAISWQDLLGSDGDPAWLKLHYLATTTARAPYAFKPVWIDHRDGKAILQKRKPRPGRGVSADVRRWSGVDPASHVLKLSAPITLRVKVL